MTADDKRRRGGLNDIADQLDPDTITLDQWRRARDAAPSRHPSAAPPGRAGVTDEARRAAALLAQLEEQFGRPPDPPFEVESVRRSNGSSAPRPDDGPAPSTSTPTGRDPATRPDRPDPLDQTSRIGVGRAQEPRTGSVGYITPSEPCENDLRGAPRELRPCTTTPT